MVDMNGTLTNAFFGLEEPKRFAGGDFLFVNSFGNVGAVDTGEGLVLFDLGLEMAGEKVFKAVRDFSKDQVRAIVLSHGHFDHAFGFGPFIEEILKNGWEMPHIIAHDNVPKRFQKYETLQEYHQWINRMQFSSIVRGKKGSLVSSATALEPTTLIKDGEPHKFTLGKYHFEVYPEWGETDDALWMFVPERKVIFAGDLCISSFPNVGNPYKVQRYPKHWALAMERMLAMEPEALLPGHGGLHEGKDRIASMLSITAKAMHFVHDEVARRMNQGKWFEQIYREMLAIYPDEFKNSEFLQPIYGDYRFAVHCAYRLYHGWYDSGNPTNLFPASREDIAKEIVELAGTGGVERMVARASQLLAEEKAQLALHVLDLVLDAGCLDATQQEAATKLKIKLLKKRASEESSFITKNIIENGARMLKEESKGG